MQASFVISKIEDIRYYITNTQTNKVHEVTLVSKEQGKAEFLGLPN
jgi:hypothetical protein